MTGPFCQKVENLFYLFYLVIEEKNSPAYHQIKEIARLNVDFTLIEQNSPEVRLVKCARRMLLSIKRVRDNEAFFCLGTNDYV
jgi:hypothetical protein